MRYYSNKLSIRADEMWQFQDTCRAQEVYVHCMHYSNTVCSMHSEFYGSRQFVNLGFKNLCFYLNR